MVTFNNQEFLVLAALILPLFLIIFLAVSRFHKTSVNKYGNRLVLKSFSKFASNKVVVLVILSFCLISLALAAAEPTLKTGESVSRKTLNAIIVIDVSRSMLAEDGPEGRTRLMSAVLATENLMSEYPDGRFGLIVYTNNVLVYAPTFDHQAIRIILADIVENYSVRGEGSDTAAALTAVSGLVEELPYEIDTVFVITDGGGSLAANTALLLTPEARDKLKELQLRLVVVGVGDLIPVAVPVYADDGELVGYHKYKGEIVYTSIDEILLRRLADDTSGYYTRLADLNGLVEITRFKNLDTQPIAQETTTSLVWIPTAVSFLMIMLLLAGKKFNIPRIF